MPLSSDSSSPAHADFAIKDCALIAIATGRRAGSVKELREILLDIDPGSVFYHFWGGLIQPRFEEREYNNDFAEFVRHGIHDAILAERLAMVDPTEHRTSESLRQEVIELIDERLEEAEYLHWVRSTRPFEFIRSQVVVFDTGRRLQHPDELADVLPELSLNSLFYHFIDARRRLAEGTDDFRVWLSTLGDTHTDLIARLAQVDPFFVSLSELRRQLADLCTDYFGRRTP